MNLVEGRLANEDGGLTFVAPGMAYVLPAVLATRLPGRRERIVLGVRPEAVSIVTDAGPGTLEGVVYVEELMGADQLLTLDVGGHLLKVRTPPDVAAGPGTRLRIRPDPGRLHLFDGETGEALR